MWRATVTFHLLLLFHQFNVPAALLLVGGLVFCTYFWAGSFDLFLKSISRDLHCLASLRRRHKASPYRWFSYVFLVALILPFIRAATLPPARWGRASLPRADETHRGEIRVTNAPIPGRYVAEVTIRAASPSRRVRDRRQFNSQISTSSNRHRLSRNSGPNRDVGRDRVRPDNRAAYCVTTRGELSRPRMSDARPVDGAKPCPRAQ